MGNTLDFKKNHRDFKTPDLVFSVSGRHITPDMDMADYLKFFFMYVNPSQIESVFGSTTSPCPLYGGRSYKQDQSLTETHIRQLDELGIGLSLTLTGHYVDDEVYEKSRAILKAHHRKGNAVICTHDGLAARIRQDFPDYTLKASIIKHLDTLEKIEKALELYDLAVLPMDKNDDDGLLKSIPHKDRIILFGNADCAYTCPARTCYLGFSQKNSGKPVSATCSRPKIARLDLGHVYFDIKKLRGYGFRNFKLVPLAPPQAGRVVQNICLKKRADHKL